MAGKKTRDGIKLSKIVKLARGLGIGVTTRTKHPWALDYAGMDKVCVLATSTHARNMVAPWIARAMGYTPTQAYEMIRRA
ncbi:MAG: hypothetical protein QF858_01335 [Candidatus Pacebacteria bacterium]|jgi:hypothetical protein|nr:hypothetical protein [Candidatus Paceibacterota bacterium]